MPQESFVKLRFKFVLPINLILVVILGASLAWEWWRLERNELGMLRTRLDEEARFVHAAAKTLVALGLEILTRHLESCVLGHAFRPRGLAGEADDEGATCRRGPDGAHTILEIKNLLNGDHHGNEIHCPRHYLRRMCGHNQEGSWHHPRRLQCERGRGDKSCHYRPRREGAARRARGSTRTRRLSRGGQFGPSAE